MTEPSDLALIHADIDGELDEHQRAELARRLLADPELRAVRDSLRQLCRDLDQLPQIEPPLQLRRSVLRRLPPEPRSGGGLWSGGGPWSGRPTPQWRYAAMLAAALVGGALLYKSGVGRGPDPNDLAGTMSAAGARTSRLLDSTHVDLGQVTGQISLSRTEANDLRVNVALASSSPVDVMIASGGRSFRIDSPRTAVVLPGPGTPGQTLQLTFLVAGRQIGAAQLRVPPVD